MSSAVRRLLLAGAVLAIAVVVLAPGMAFAATATTSTPTASAMPSLTASPSVSATAPYALDFTLPTESKAGCMVCHGDKNLTRLKGGKQVSYYVDGAAYSKSIHAKTLCVGCHLDFAYTAPHDGVADWQSTAKLACKNCHQKQFLSTGQGVHGRATNATGTAAAAEAKKPLCGDCHGGHDMQKLTDSPDGIAALRANAYEICGRCHQDYWDSYNDYYHGAAFKAGAADAPACWDCHGWHDILPSKDPASLVNKAHLVETCGSATTGSSCHAQHKDASDRFIEDAAQMIHGKQAAREKNPLLKFLGGIWNGIARLFGK